jgi:uncharacterized membrane protein
MGKRRNSPEPPPLSIEFPVLHVQPPVRLDGRPGALLCPEDALSPAGARRVVALEGPIPLPETLAEYDTMMPGLALRIVDWAEREAEHRRAVERSMLRMAWGGLWCALLVSLTTIGGGMALVWQGRSTVGLVGVVGAVAGLVIVFVAGRRRAPLPVDVAARQMRRDPREAAA